MTAAGYRILHRFCSDPNCADGAGPAAGLIADSAGNLYGTTSAGGAQNSGTVYRIAAFSVIHSFCSLASCADGAFPGTRLTLGKEGLLYGTAGLVFKMTTEGDETVIYRFKRKYDGSGPNSALAIDRAGNLYGTTSNDTFGHDSCAAFGPDRDCGTVFRITPQGRERILYVFPNGPGGAFPEGDLLLRNGVLYGTTEFGGDNACGFDGCGIVYSLKLR